MRQHNPPRIFLDSCVLIEGLLSPFSNSRGVLILGRASIFQFVLAEIVLEETERRIMRGLKENYDGFSPLYNDYCTLLARLKIERVPHVSGEQFQHARQFIRHVNDIPVLAAAIEAKPDWVITDNTAHFDVEVAQATGLVIVTPRQFLHYAGRIFPL